MVSSFDAGQITTQDAGIKFGKMDREWTRSIDAVADQVVHTNVLDPDDSLMKKFQDALRAHLIRVDDRLSSEISELVSTRQLVLVISRYDFPV